MSRPLRITYPDAFYHITSRGNEQKAVFKNKQDRIKFLEYLESSSERYDAVIHAYCMMDNHYHLLLETPSGNLPQIMRHINGAYTTYFNVKRDRSGHLFQGRYKAILVDRDEYAKELSRYIHLNPVRAKIVEHPEEYEWSSYVYYIGRKKKPEWLNTDFILGYFGRKRALAEKGYQKFVNILEKAEYESPLKDVVSSTLLGSSDFITYIKDKYISGKGVGKDIPAIKELLERVPLNDIFKEVEDIFSDNRVLSRNVKIYLCKKYSRKKLSEIGTYFNIGESGVSQAYRRLSEIIERDKRLKLKIDRIIKSLNLSRMKT
jgi:putative transposase